ncbi:LLM class F420-dependent oxidoreductase [Sciscionella sediminilitoris]|uniref:LLM class F420-dependent oxidoreductase n=1 Tax=Sciscionella sediminilitoris TaxID=1445613 RepID=UPI0004DF1411|nr:LLM class F420-dependent oxidoreductase [Sciscionella sp. SE31]
MRLGTHIWSFTGSETADGGTAGELARVGTIAEQAGIADVSVMDHFFQMDRVRPAEEPMLEGYSALSFLAGHTSSVRLGLLVGGVTYRYPGLLAKTVTTLDVLSGGRAWFGIGAGWYEREHQGLGVPFPPTAERFERLEETLRVCQAMWDPASTAPFEGKHFQLAETLCSPAPISDPHPPVLIGGGGERKTLRLVAQYADACNLGTDAGSVDEIAHKLEVLRNHCADVGRDYAQIHKTMLYTGGELHAGDQDGFVEAMAGYAEIGIQTVFVMPPGDRPSEWIEQNCAPVVPRLAAL